MVTVPAGSADEVTGGPRRPPPPAGGGRPPLFPANSTAAELADEVRPHFVPREQPGAHVTMPARQPRNSDRWVTPTVVATGVVVAGVLVLSVVAAVTYLTAMGRDPDPMLRLVAQCVTAMGSLGTLLLQLTGRATTAKVERNTGVLASEVHALQVRGRHHAPDDRTAPASPGR